MVATAIAGSQIAHFIDIVENPTLPENGLHHEWRRHTANGQAVRTDRLVKVVCGLPASAAVHVLHHNNGISGDILLEKRNNGFGPHAPDSAWRATLKDGNGFPLEERTLRKSDAAHEETEQQRVQIDLQKHHRLGPVVSHRPSVICQGIVGNETKLSIRSGS